MEQCMNEKRRVKQQLEWSETSFNNTGNLVAGEGPVFFMVSTENTTQTTT